jgi:hypothetical protein
MKYTVSIILMLITSVAFVYYLFNNPNFLPLNNFGEYNWINILTLLFFITLILFSLLNILIYGILFVFKKELKKKEKIIICIKYSLAGIVGILTVFTLNFFHILNWTWGTAILIVVLIFTFII